MEEEKKSVAPKATKAKKATAPKASSEAKPAASKKPAIKKDVVKKEAPKAAEVVAPKEETKVAAPKASKKAEPKVVEVTAPKVEAKIEAPKDSKKEAPKAPAKTKITHRLKDKFEQVIVAKLMTKYGYKSVMQVPHLEKVIINIGVGDAITNSKLLDDSVRELREITGQQPVITKAKKSIANFKLREGQAIGCKVTLRSLRMYDFLDKLVSIALPRVRDFRGVSRNAFDGHGNYTLGVKEQLIFPEIDYDKVNKIRGMDIVIVTTAKNDDEAFALLSELGMPFRK
jgi:large subunit ribosomal protein L5